MKHGSLFSGIGGFDLAAEWMGWTNRFHCEINPFCQRVLKHYWPNAESYDDIKTTDFTVWRGKIDILTGGFPCQPYSAAGKRLGKEDDRHLWPEMLRAIREISPRWIVGENVRGLTNWNGGLVFDEVQADLETEGYEIIPFLLPACAVNAPHRRDRIWFIAYHTNTRIKGVRRERENAVYETISSPYSEGQQNIRNGQGGLYAEFTGINEQGTTSNPRLLGQKECEIETAGIEQCGKGNDTPDTDSKGLEGWPSEGNGKNREWESSFQIGIRWSNQRYGGRAWENFPTQPPVCSGDDELPRELDGITFSKWRNESIKGYGNAVVPKLVYEIFKAIESYEQLTTPSPAGRGIKRKR